VCEARGAEVLRVRELTGLPLEMLVRGRKLTRPKDDIILYEMLAHSTDPRVRKFLTRSADKNGASGELWLNG
jgi:hypothetical protein